MNDQFPKTNRAFRLQTKVEGVREFAESAVVKSLAALLVGGLAFYGICFESRSFRIAAASFGLLLPALHLLAVGVTPWIIRRIIRHVDEESPYPRRKLRKPPRGAA
jgi:hypothetical protein